MNSADNVRDGAISGFAQFVTFRLRAMHNEDLAVLGTEIVLTP